MSVTEEGQQSLSEVKSNGCKSKNGETKEKTTDINDNAKSGRLEEGNKFVQSVLDAIFSDQFAVANQMIESDKCETEMHWALAKLFVHCFHAFITFEADYVDRALAEAAKVEKLCNKIRKKYSVTESFQSWFGKTDYGSYTDEEVLAELIYADSLMVSSMLTMLSPNHGFTDVIRAAFRTRAANQAFKLCEQIANAKTNWTSTIVQNEVEAGYCMGLGFSNLILSNLPEKALKLLAFVGFTGDYKVAKALLNKGMYLKSYQAHSVSHAVVSYNMYIGQIFGLGDIDIPWSEEALSQLRKHYSKGSIIYFLTARLERLKGNLTQALDLYQKSIDSQSEWKQMHNICHWDMAWCHALLEDWENASHRSGILLENCDWSKAVFAYQRAIFNAMILAKTNDKAKLKQSIEEDLKMVSKLRKRYGGKTAPHEKLAVVRAAEYLESGQTPNFITVCEFYYIWNLITTESSPDIINPVLERLTAIQKEGGLMSPEEEALLNLFKGICLRNIGRYGDAFSFISRSGQMKDQLPKKSYVPAHVALEFGLTYFKAGDLESAKEWLTKARDNYSKYLIETMVHLRVHLALKAIKKLESPQD